MTRILRREWCQSRRSNRPSFPALPAMRRPCRPRDKAEPPWSSLGPKTLCLQKICGHWTVAKAGYHSRKAVQACPAWPLAQSGSASLMNEEVARKQGGKKKITLNKTCIDEKGRGVLTVHQQYRAYVAYACGIFSFITPPSSPEQAHSETVEHVLRRHANDRYFCGRSGMHLGSTHLFFSCAAAIASRTDTEQTPNRHEEEAVHHSFRLVDPELFVQNLKLRRLLVISSVAPWSEI